MKLKTVFEKLKETEEGRAAITYTQKLQAEIQELKANEESTIAKATETLDRLEEELYLAEEKLGEVFAGFFLHIRTKIVEPKGLELGKTSKEITQMTLETIDLYLKEKVDYAEVERLLEEAGMDETEGDHIPRVD